MKNNKRFYLFSLLVFIFISNTNAQTVLVPTGSSWKYLDNGSNQGTGWKATTIDETGWSQGSAELGYGDGDEATVVSYGPSATNKYITTYFRKTFTIADASLFVNYTLNVKRDDGVAVYVNGNEVYRDNLAAGAAYTTLATIAASDDGGTFQTTTLPIGTLVTGSNTIAVEIHQNAANSSDISFDLGLIGISTADLIPINSSWKYLDNGSNQGTAWKATTIDETGWSQGNAELGYGDGDEATVVSYGPSSTNKYITTYFRKTFTIADASLFVNYTLNVKRDDGVAVYVNGNEVYRDNLAAGATYTTLAALASDDGATFQTTTLPIGTFVTGSNTIAVEIHQTSATSTDISFDLGLIGNLTAPITQKHIRWGTTKDQLEGLTIAWTNSTAATTDQIKWGYTTAYEQGATNVPSRAGYSAATNKFYSFTFPGVLTPNATLYYSLFDSVSGTWSAQRTYTTSPPLNTNTFSFAAVGDSRTNVGVWNTISTLLNARNPAFVLFNGDIVETGGSASEWDAWFDNGSNLINNKLIFHAQGNHDVASASYYQNIFDLPKNNIPATELYYSVNYGEAIFICLDSENPGDTAQRTWLTNTLAANATKKWKIISFHRPFYTVGPHAGDMDNYWNTWFKDFDDYGVDLILTGHDHLYERFKPINRNVSTTLPVANYGSLAGEGRCQVVCGGAGAPLYAAGTSSLLQTFKSDFHYVMFDVTNTTLCGTVYDDSNVVIDNFCINKPYLSTDPPKPIFYPIKLYPNPVKESFKVEYSSPNIGDVKINIYDIKGKLIATQKAVKSSTEFTYTYNASSLSSGVYVFEIQMGNQKDNSIWIRE